ncbi:DUF6344 domain-containing protein [Streptomyces sp. CA-100214]
MKQRIRAEAHGSAPSCRHRPLSDATATATETATGLPCDDTAGHRPSTARRSSAERAEAAPGSHRARPARPDTTAICVPHHTRETARPLDRAAGPPPCVGSPRRRASPWPRPPAPLRAS